MLNLRHTPTNTRHLLNVGAMLGQRRRRWPNIASTLSRCLVFAGTALVHHLDNVVWLNQIDKYQMKRLCTKYKYK